MSSTESRTNVTGKEQLTRCSHHELGFLCQEPQWLYRHLSCQNLRLFSTPQCDHQNFLLKSQVTVMLWADIRARMSQALKPRLKPDRAAWIATDIVTIETMQPAHETVRPPAPFCAPQMGLPCYWNIDIWWDKVWVNFTPSHQGRLMSES